MLYMWYVYVYLCVLCYVCVISLMCAPYRAGGVWCVVIQAVEGTGRGQKHIWKRGSIGEGDTLSKAAHFLDLSRAICWGRAYR